MPRQKKEHFEYVEKLGRYRKRIKDADGKQLAIYGKTERELAEKLAAVRAELAEMQRYAGNPLVSDYAARWLSRRTAELGAKYREQYETAVRLHIVPVIGEKRLRELSAADCEAVLTAMSGKSASLRGKVLNALRQLLDAAVDENLIGKNLAARMKAGGKKTEKKKALTTAQQETLLEAVKGLKVETFVRLCLHAGLRREEALALQWDAVHLDGTPHIEVKRALRWEHNQPVVSERLKTAAAHRIIPIPPELADHLAHLRKMAYVIGGEKPLTQSAYKSMWGQLQSRQTGEKTYTDTTGATPIKRTFTRRLGEKSRAGNFCYTIDFAVTPHQLRHTYASNLISRGVDPKTVQYLMGHTDAEFTLEIYTHIIDHSPEALAEKLKPAL